MNPRLLLFFWFYLFLISCEKYIKDDYPEESGCEQWAGKYDMYDPINDTNYTMIVDCAEGDGTLNDLWDSLYFENFANLFEFGLNLPTDGSFSGTIIQPLTDKYGYRWTFGNVYFPDTLNRINVRVIDSLYLYMDFNNQAYWIDDGVPYQTFTTVHPGKKIH